MNSHKLFLILFLVSCFGFSGCVPSRHKMISEDDLVSRQNQKALEVEKDEDEEILGINYKDECEISYCRIKYLDKHDATHLGDALFGEEYTHGYLTLRTQDKSRAGMYFFVMLSGPDDIAKGSKIEIDVDSNATKKVNTYTFTVPETHSLLREMKLGITGKDWAGKDEKVNAWNIKVFTPDGTLAAEKSSWLWSMPDEKNESSKD